MRALDAIAGLTLSATENDAAATRPMVMISCKSSLDFGMIQAAKDSNAPSQMYLIRRPRTEAQSME
jgi:hypothetical protein